MGTWGAGGFENDCALDFVGEINAVEDLVNFYNGPKPAVDEEFDADLSQQIVVAAECVATMMGRPSADCDDGLRKKLKSFGEPSAELIESARNTLSAMLFNSELMDLWAEDDPESWNTAIASLIDRLNPDIKVKKIKARKNKYVEQLCGFCNESIKEDELMSLNVEPMYERSEYGSGVIRGFWCHMRCLNAKVHPRHIIQDWKFDPDNLPDT